MIIHENVEQGSQEWHDMRLGKITASRIKDVMTNGRGSNISKTAETYMFELLAEILTGETKPFFVNDAMRWGTETEPQARAMYELRNDVEVKEVAFIELNEFVGMSPDGLVGDNGLVEIKCPATITQLKRALTDDYSSDYKAQIQMQLWVSGRQWCDFVSFDPRLSVEAGYLQCRVERDEEFIQLMNDKVSLLVESLKSNLERFTNE